MKIEFDVKKIQIITGRGSDLLLMTVDLPEGILPFRSSDAVIKMDLAAGTAQQYVKDNINKDIEIKVIRV